MTTATEPGTVAAETEKHQFQAETRKLLDLMIHSLYSKKEIFLRELISNASDALDRMRFEALTNDAVEVGDEEQKIQIEASSLARTVTIRDNGIGMSRQEVIDNIGTIARSGSKELMDRIRGVQKQAEEGAEDGVQQDSLVQLIGQFGVGFYSSFMVADRVELVTRRAGEETATRWVSEGAGEYELSAAERPSHGTTITLYLKPEDKDHGLDDFTDEFVLKRIIKRYSDFVTYPIVLKTERQEVERDEDGKPKEDAPKKTVVEETTVNSRVPVWSKSESEVTDQEYAEFYRHISHDWNEPMAHITLRAEGRFEYQSLMFIPGEAPYDLFYVGHEPGLQLYVKRVMIMERCEELLPRYLRFVKGVVDSPDLPLNVSREMLQNDRMIQAIRKGLVKKLLDTFADWQKSDADKYAKLWGQFGRAIKEGVGEDWQNKDKLVELLMFASSREGDEPTTLADYVSRMKADQKEIYYLTGESLEQVASSPHLEAFRDKGYEVLYLVDSVDELMTQYLTEYDGKKLKSVGKGTVELGDEKEREERKKELEAREEQLKGLMERLQQELDENVKHVRLSNRLTSSPACLVGADHDYSPQLEKLLQKGKGGGPKQRRILELNPGHPIIAKMQEHYAEAFPEAPEAAEAAAAEGDEKKAAAKKGDAKKAAGPKKGRKKKAADFPVADYAHLLFGYGALAEGSELPDPVRFNQAVAALMERSL